MEKQTIPYPFTLIMDRYGGTYSGGQFLAINQFYDEIDTSIGGCDSEEMIFWSEFKQGEPIGFLNDKMYIGKGNTPQEAINDLIKLIYNEN
jgi:hypothetical protein